jgi:hypothetical protein
MRRQGIFLLLLSVLFFFQTAEASGDQIMGPEYDVKIGFIYNFANFVTWPAAAFEKEADTLNFCFASDQPSGEVFFKLDGKTIKGRKIKVAAYPDITCLEKSHIMFFPTQNKMFIQHILDLVKGKRVLTIGEVEGFTHMGGIINFFVENNRLRFKVNIDAARREGLKMSAQLLNSAQIVKDDQQKNETF